MLNKSNHFVLVSGSLYININLNIFYFFFLIYGKTKTFQLFDRPTNKISMKLLPGIVIKTIRVLHFTYAFHKEKNNVKKLNKSSIIATPHFGHCLLKLRQGKTKIFNLKDSQVITILPSYLTDSEVKESINNLIQAQKCSFAPGINNWDFANRFVVEPFINGEAMSLEITSPDWVYDNFYHLLVNIITTTGPKTVSLETIQTKKVNQIVTIIKEVDREPLNKNIILDFLTYIQKKLNTLSLDDEIHIVFSHGDLWRKNILVSGDKYHIIDWNTHGYRSCYFDFYYALFMATTTNTHLDKVNGGDLVELSRNLDLFCKSFHKKLKEYFKNASDRFSVYRYLFYIELILLKLENDNLNEEIKTWINRFKIIEDQIYGTTVVD